MNHIKQVLIFYRCLPTFGFEGGFTGILSIITSGCYCLYYESDGRIQWVKHGLLLSYATWILVWMRFIKTLGKALEDIRKSSRSRNKGWSPKSRVRQKKVRRKRLPFFKRNIHRKQVRLKLKREYTKLEEHGWESVVPTVLPLHKQLSLIGSFYANMWEEACTMNPYLVSLTCLNDPIFERTSWNRVNELLFSVEDNVFDISKIVETQNCFRFQAGYHLNSKTDQIIFDSGASVTISPERNDFITLDANVKGVHL